MDRRQLAAALQAAGVDSRYYGIQGVGSDGWPVEGHVFLAQDIDGVWWLGSRKRGVWWLGSWEREVETRERDFTSEEEACQYLYDYLTRPRFRLAAALQAAGVDSRHYAIQGVVSESWLADGGVFLAEDADGVWWLGSQERGVETRLRDFASEEEACQYLYDYLTRPRPEPRRLTPEENAASRERTRQLIAEHRREVADQLPPNMRPDPTDS